MSKLSVPVQQELLALGHRYVYPAEVPLVRQGTDGSDVYLLEAIGPHPSVCAKVTLVSPNGCESLLGLRTSGDLIGESAALFDTPRAATVVTAIPTAAYKFGRSAFVEFLGHRPEANLSVMKTMAQRLEWANHRRLEIHGYNVPARLARVILEILDRYGRPAEGGTDVGVQLSQHEWGQLIGASASAIRKATKTLCELDLIKNHYLRLIVTDLAGLRRYAE